MKKAKVQLWQQSRGYATVEDGATKGATFGLNLWWPDGSLVKQSDFTNAGAPVQQGTPSQTLWSLVLQIPTTVKNLAAATGSGFYTSAGVFRAVSAGEVTYDPTTSGLTATDVQAAIDETVALIPATTDDLPEGSTNLYFTDARAYAATKAALQAGTHTGVSFAFDDGAHSISVTAGGGGGGGSFDIRDVWTFG